MAFIFYDTETTGTDTYFDQILQFAGIRTDEDLNAIETFNIRNAHGSSGGGMCSECHHSSD
jgi:exodeoxyribonuclease-1